MSFSSTPGTGKPTYPAWARPGTSGDGERRSFRHAETRQHADALAAMLHRNGIEFIPHVLRQAGRRIEIHLQAAKKGFTQTENPLANFERAFRSL